MMLWMVFLLFMSSLLMCTTCLLMLVSQRIGYLQGEIDNTPIRLKNGQLIARPK